MPNRYTIIGMLVEGITILLTGHLTDEISLHIMGFVIILLLTLTLYSMGAIGGADVKTLIIVTLSSPGLEFVKLDNPANEALVGSGIIVGLTLLFALIVSHYQHQITNDHQPVPLIPLILIAYLVAQIIGIALFGI